MQDYAVRRLCRLYIAKFPTGFYEARDEKCGLRAMFYAAWRSFRDAAAKCKHFEVRALATPMRKRYRG